MVREKCTYSDGKKVKNAFGVKIEPFDKKMRSAYFAVQIMRVLTKICTPHILIDMKMRVSFKYAECRHL